MKYYIKENRMQAFYTEGAIEIESPIREDGTILPKHKNLHLLELYEDGNQARLYMPTIGVDGKYPINYDKIKLEDDLVSYNEAKTIAKEAIATIKVVVTSGIEFYADPESRTDLSDAISIMNEQSLSEYSWKTTTGIQIVSLVDMVEARTLGLIAKGNLVGVTSEQ